MGSLSTIGAWGAAAAGAAVGGYGAYHQAGKYDAELKAFAALPDAERLRRHEADDLPLKRYNAMMLPILGGTGAALGGLAGAWFFGYMNAPKTTAAFGGLAIAGIGAAGGALAGYIAYKATA